jgi:hypothetical protein
MKPYLYNCIIIFFSSALKKKALKKKKKTTLPKNSPRQSRKSAPPPSGFQNLGEAANGPELGNNTLPPSPLPLDQVGCSFIFTGDPE